MYMFACMCNVIRSVLNLNPNPILTESELHYQQIPLTNYKSHFDLFSLPQLWQKWFV